MQAKDIRISAPATLAFAAEGMCWGSFAAQIPVLKAHIGASDSQFGLAMLFASAGAVLAMWLSPLVDKVLHSRAMAVLAVGMALSFLTPGFAGTVWVFAVCMLFAAMFSGTLDVIMNARVSSVEAVIGRSVMSYHHGVFSAAYAVSAFLTGLARAADWSSFQIYTVILILIALGAIVMLRPLPVRISETGPERSHIALGWVVILIGSVILIAFFTEQSTEAWSALHLERGLGADAVGGALGPTLLGATMALGRFSGQFLQKHFGLIRIIYCAALMSALGAFIAAGAGTVMMAYLGFTILGLGVSVIVPLGLAILGQVVSEETRTKAIARAAAFGYVGFFVGPPIMGFLSEWHGLAASFTFVGISLLLVPLLTMPLTKRLT